MIGRKETNQTKIKQGKYEKIFLSETTRPRALIVDLYQFCSNYATLYVSFEKTQVSNSGPFGHFDFHFDKEIYIKCMHWEMIFHIMDTDNQS